MKNNTLSKLKGGLVVSCQAQNDEPLRDSFIMGKMALAAYQGGAVAIRAESVSDIIEIKKNVPIPIIGLIKQEYPNTDRYITPTMKEINELIELKVDIIAMDATNRPQIDNISLKDKVIEIKKHNILAMADVSTLEEAINAEKNGFDLISTTLSGYTSHSPQIESPDYKLIKKSIKRLEIPVLAEGKIFCLSDLEKIIRLKPYAIVIGSAITRPQIITEKYVEYIKGKR